MVTVEEKDWHSFAKALKETRGLEFDVLTAVVGMDWKDSLGVVYYLTSTSRNWEVISVKVAVADRENPMIHSVSDLWKVANFQEREVFDFLRHKVYQPSGYAQVLPSQRLEGLSFEKRLRC